MANPVRDTLLMSVVGVIFIVWARASINQGGHSLYSSFFIYLGFAFLVPLIGVTVAIICYIPFLLFVNSARVLFSTTEDEATEGFARTSFSPVPSPDTLRASSLPSSSQEVASESILQRNSRNYGTV